MIPQLLIIGIAAFGLVLGLAKSGKEDVGTTILSTLVIHVILYWGGFYAPLLAKFN